MASTLQLNRATDYVMELRRGTFHVLLDGKDVGSIERNSTIELPVESGQHTLQVKEGRFTSPERTFDSANGDTVNFRCNGAVVWPVYVASLVKTDMGLRLKRQ
jgi:hypothetical protein